MNTEAVNTYRKKHRRCKTCVYAQGTYNWICKAKNQRYNIDLDKSKTTGMFCKLYTPKLIGGSL